MSDQLPRSKPNRQPVRTHVVADPHIVYYDAVLNSPWNESGGTNLPSREDWSTYRCASKDIIVGVVTHRFNRQMRRLDIRAYFVGEHPVFRAMEPTKILLIVLCSQAYQAGGLMELHFEQGIPFDVRQLIEDRLGKSISGHETTITDSVARELYGNLSHFSPEEQRLIADEHVQLERVCFNIFRGTWSAGLIKTLLRRGVPMRWIFGNRPNPIGQPTIHAHLFYHLRAAMMEEYALHRLADRKLGTSAGKRIQRTDTAEGTFYVSEHLLAMSDPRSANSFDADSSVQLAAHQPFCLVPVLAHSPTVLPALLERDLARAQQMAGLGTPILILPLDFIYLQEHIRLAYTQRTRECGVHMLIIGLTLAQLLSEAEFNLAVTAAQLDESEVETNNADRYAD